MQPSFTAPLNQLVQLPPLALYIHIPWCIRKCPYCDFNSHATQGHELALPVQHNYLKALLADLATSKPLIEHRTIQSIFIGGGTPSLISPEVLAQLLEHIHQQLSIAPECEITMEANPGTHEKDRFHAFKQTGVTRLSLGVQSFNDDKLKALGRIHNAAQAKAAIEEAQNAFDTFNLDLMYALPAQSMEELIMDLRTSLSFEPPHLSVYHLTLEANTYFAKYPPKVPDDDLAAQMLDTITEYTQRANMQRYEVSAYAKAQHQCVHNRNYWEFGDYLGIGAGAHGKITQQITPTPKITRHIKHREPSLYMRKALEGKAFAQTYEVQQDELPFEFMLGALRLKQGVPLHLFEQRTGLCPQTIETALQKAKEQGLLSPEKNRLTPSEKGFDFLSDLQELFLP